MSSRYRYRTKRYLTALCLLAICAAMVLYTFPQIGLLVLPRCVGEETLPAIPDGGPKVKVIPDGRPEVKIISGGGQEAKVIPEVDPEVKVLPGSPEVKSISDGGPEVKVILLTRMRSGSSFTGNVFNHHPDAFYVYEPLWWIDGYRLAYMPAEFFNRPPVDLNKISPAALDALRVELINASLSCRFESSLVRPLMDNLTFWQTDSYAPYQRCTDDQPGVLGMIRCLPVLRHRCTKASVAVAKTIRLPMRLARRLLTSDPAYRVIHLVRDPRGVLHSMNTSGLVRDKFQGVSPRRLCDEVLQDLEESERLKRQFPRRVLTVRYEDLARELQPLSRRLLRFSGLAMHPGLDHYLRSVASPKGRQLSPERVSRRWRRRVRWAAVEKINAVCSPVFRLAGYLPLNASSLPDLGQPSYRPQGEVPGLWDG